MPGCLDCSPAANPLQDDRINVFERWESDEDLMRFRNGEAGDGPDRGPWPMLRDAWVARYRTASVEAP